MTAGSADRAAAQLLATYPRVRPPLPQSHQAIYVDHYRTNRAGAAGLGRVVRGLEAWMHRRVARGCGGSEILELGAGTLNHLPYHPETRAYDVVEPFRALWEDSPALGRVRRVFADLDEIPTALGYDAILSVAVLEHLTGLPRVLARCGALLREGGEFRAGFPSEGGFLWGLAWRTTTSLSFRLRHGLDYGALMRHEHVNSATEILTLLRHFFREVEVARFPLPFNHLSFYTAAIAREPRRERCATFSESQRA